MANGESFVIDAERVENRRVQVVDIDRVFHGVKSEFVGAPKGNALFNSAPGHPHGESVGVMVASPLFAGPLDNGRPPKLTAPNDQRFVE
jgi:hypothetical protein